MPILERLTGSLAVMWGSSIVGFGRYEYPLASGKTGESCITGFSPRKSDLTLYIMPGFERYPDLMARLGKHRTGRSCLYIKRLSDVHTPTLKKLIRESVKSMKKLVRERAQKKSS